MRMNCQSLINPGALMYAHVSKYNAENCSATRTPNSHVKFIKLEQALEEINQ